jgi:antitoxin component YwqK of YwqJK toxin-antitoxin module
MKRMLVALFVMIIVPVITFAGITKKVVEKHPDISSGDRVLPGAPKTVIYSDESGKEVAKELYDDQGNLLETIGAIPDGIVNEYYESGKVRHQIEYKNNLRDGPCVLFLENGNTAVSWDYRDGMREGMNKVYYPSGALHFALPYENNEREGIAREYYESGKVKAEYTYKNGVQEGTTTNYYENGKVQSTATYKDGKKIEINTYNPAGNPIKQ